MLDRKQYENPQNIYRIYRLSHGMPEDCASTVDTLQAQGFGGVVLNAAWHEKPEDTEKYLQNEADFAALEHKIDVCTQKGFGVWLYDEKGYPSGSADGLTLAGHPEYEAKGFTAIETHGKPYQVEMPFEKVIYATDETGAPAAFDETGAENAHICYVTSPVFEGSHAQKCGWGPRRYPNLMDKEAIAAFIHCTYDRYYEKIKHFDAFEAVFTDEPSLMSAYVNCSSPMKHTFLPWHDTLPDVFRQMHGVSLYEIIGELFDETDTYRPGKRMFWETVAEMVNNAYFKQIAAWCDKHHIRFSGHALLEECISMHVPLYGNLLKCLKSFDYPGVDMLTGDPKAFLHNETMQYCMAAKYVGSVARMTGKTSKVMVEICPLCDHNNGGDFTVEQEIGTMDLLFFAGINHINSYLDPSRLNGKSKLYADYFARASYVLRDSRWNGKIGVYYPIETMQGYYHPSNVGVNTGAVVTPTEKRVEATLFRLHRQLYENGLDFTVVDAAWLKKASLSDGVFALNGLEISALVMPAVAVLDEAVRVRLTEFQKQGGLVVWCEACPEDMNEPLTEDPVPLLKAHIPCDLSVEADFPKELFIGSYSKDGKRLYYLINASDKINMVKVSFADGAPFEVWHNLDGTVTEDADVTLDPYTSVFVVEQ